MSKTAPNRVAHFTFDNIPRSKVSEAPYNPRAIDGFAAEKLSLVLQDEEIGLVEPLVWNKRTGHLVGGHQRLALMDGIHSDVPDYEIPVAVIDVDEATEKRINILLNNPSIQGTWDTEKLESLFRNGVDPFVTGFDLADIEMMYDSTAVLEFVEKYHPERLDEGAGSLPGTPDASSVSNTADEIAKIKEARKGHKEADRESLRSDHSIVIVFETADDCTRALNALKLNPTETFVFADRFAAAVKEHVERFHQVVTKKPA